MDLDRLDEIVEALRELVYNSEKDILQSDLMLIDDALLNLINIRDKYIQKKILH